MRKVVAAARALCISRFRSWLSVWSLVSSIWIFPHDLAYFNELVGGPLSGHEHLVGSNIDWGQDLRYLKQWLKANPESRPLHFAYFGYLDPVDVGVKFAAPPTTVQSLSDLRDQPSGWYAASVSLLRGYPWFVPDGDGGVLSISQEGIAGLLRLPPVDHVGYSIYVYRIAANAGALLDEPRVFLDDFVLGSTPVSPTR